MRTEGARWLNRPAKVWNSNARAEVADDDGTVKAPVAVVYCKSALPAPRQNKIFFLDEPIFLLICRDVCRHRFIKYSGQVLLIFG